MFQYENYNNYMHSSITSLLIRRPYVSRSRKQSIIQRHVLLNN